MMGGEKQYRIVWFNNIISILSLVTGNWVIGTDHLHHETGMQVRAGEI